VSELSGWEQVGGEAVHVVQRDIEARRDHTGLVDAAQKLDHNLATALIIDQLKFLQVMMKHGYIGEFELIDDKRSGKIVIQLLGRINKAGVISPRFDVSLNDMDRFTSYLLPSGQFGHLVLTTSYGILDHQECIRKHTGGKILGYFY